MRIDPRFFHLHPKAQEWIQSLNELGFVVLDKIDAQKLDELRSASMDLIQNLPKKDKGSQLLNLINASYSVKLASNEIIKRLFNPILAAYISTEEADIFPVSHILKPFGLKSDIWHQDSSIVDERTAFSLNAWISLIPSNRMNGCLWVIPGSHKNDNHFRQFGYNPVQGLLLKKMNKKLVPIEVDAGEIVLFHRNILHGSSRNWLPKTRVALESVVVSKGAQLYNFHREEALHKNQIMGFKVDMEHFLRENPKADFYNGRYSYELYEDLGFDGITSKLSHFIDHL